MKIHQLNSRLLAKLWANIPKRYLGRNSGLYMLARPKFGTVHVFKKKLLHPAAGQHVRKSCTKLLHQIWSLFGSTIIFKRLVCLPPESQKDPSSRRICMCHFSRGPGARCIWSHTYTPTKYMHDFVAHCPDYAYGVEASAVELIKGLSWTPCMFLTYAGPNLVAQ